MAFERLGRKTEDRLFRYPPTIGQGTYSVNPLFSGRFRALRGVKIFFLKGLDRTKFLVYPTIMNMTMWQLLMQIFLASEFAYMHPQISQVEPSQWRR